MSFDRVKLRAQIARHEGLKLHAYKDSLGFLTIGYGRLIDQRKGGGLTQEEADHLLDNDIYRTCQELDTRIPWWRELDDVRQRVLIDMAFNLGVGGLLTFKNTLAAVKASDFKKAAANMRKSLWASQVKSRAVRLSEMMETGEDI